VYSRTLTIKASELPESGRVWLDLGEVKELASVKINGKMLGTAWKAPYRLDITGTLHAGANSLEISVTNLWVNRLIGDVQPGATKKYTFTTSAPYKADDPLLPSGLLGPVRLVAETTKRATEQVGWLNDSPRDSLRGSSVIREGGNDPAVRTRLLSVARGTDTAKLKSQAH
jgi:hypothetical protein